MFEHIMAQEKAGTIIANFIKSGRFPQSLLFHGPQGVGKFLLAKSIVKYFNCPNTDNNQKGNDNCNICSRIEHEIYPDFFIIKTEKSTAKSGKDKESKVIKIEQVKDITRQIQYKPFESEYKFFIVDGAETMNVYAENAFLKTLEEPLPNNYIILIAHNTNMILPTIYSRCIKVRFDPLPPDVLKKLIRKEFELDDELLEKISFLAGGSMYKVRILMEDEMYKYIFEIFDQVTLIITGDLINIEDLMNVSGVINKMELSYIYYFFDLLLLYVTESYSNFFYNTGGARFFKYCLNFKTKNIKLYNNIVNEILISKYYLSNSNVDLKLLIENLLLKIRESL